MQTGTTPARRIATEPVSDRSAPPTGPCRIAITAPTGTSGTSPAAETTALDAGVAA